MECGAGTVDTGCVIDPQVGYMEFEGADAGWMDKIFALGILWL